MIDDLSTELELARHMRALLENRAWARQLGDAGRRTVEALSWDAIASQTMQVYQELPGRSP